MKPYPNLGDRLMADILRILEVVVRERKYDIQDFDNLTQTFLLGRKVSKIPTGALDIVSTDKVGDINYTTSYLYVVVDNAGTAEWRRTALSSW